MNAIERLREQTELGKLLSLALFSYSLPRESVHDADALCVFPGLGEDDRVIYPADKYWNENNTQSRFLLVAGHNKAEAMWEKLSRDRLSKPPYNVRRLEHVIVEEHAPNTKAQADWLCSKIRELSITSCVLCATPFHLLRAYLTTLASFNATGLRIPLVPLPVPRAPGSIVPELRTDAWTLVQGELDRIELYQGKGDIISYEGFRTYLDWLWDQPIVKNNL